MAIFGVVDPRVYVVMALQSCSKFQRRCTTSSTSVALLPSHGEPGNIVLGAEGAASYNNRIDLLEHLGPTDARAHSVRRPSFDVASWSKHRGVVAAARRARFA